MVKATLSEFIKEARRRRVFRIAALYVVGAWVLLQVADLAFPAFGIPDLAMRYVWLGALLGFPVAILFSWQYDVSKGRVVRTKAADKNTDLRLNRTDYVILSVFVSVVVAIVVGLASEIVDTQPVREDASWTGDLDPASIAVLPFVNIGPNSENAYIAEGLADEVLNRLARAGGLRVTARRSSFSFKDINVDVREVGRRLSAANVVEGSVRVAGDALRVSAQLVDSKSGLNIWSETYDRSMADIFAIQKEIAEDITAALQKNLGVIGDTPQSHSSTDNLEAYGYYLRGRALARKLSYSDTENYDAAIRFFIQATETDPAFADAFAALADAYSQKAYWLVSNFRPKNDSELRELAKSASKAATDLAPQSSEALRAFAMTRDDPSEAISALRRSVAANDNNSDAILELGWRLMEQGAIDEGTVLIRKAHLLDPLNGGTTSTYSMVLAMENRLVEASEYYQLSQEQSGAKGSLNMGSAELASWREEVAQYPDEPGDLNFEDSGQRWIVGDASFYDFSRSDESFSGANSMLIESREGVSDSNSTVVKQRLPAESYRGKFLRVSCMMKTRNIKGNASIFVTAWGSLGESIALGNGWPGYIRKDSDWIRYEVRVFVPQDTAHLSFGPIMAGEGQAWFDNFRIEVADDPHFESIVAVYGASPSE